MHVYLGHDEQPPVAFLSFHVNKDGAVWAWLAAVLTKDGLGYAISSSNAGSVRGWDAVTGSRISNLKGQRNKVLSLRLVDPRVCPAIPS